MAFCVIFTMIWNTTPISASVTDNLNSVIAKILGKQNDTTTKANYKNASVTAKLNYLEDEMANLKTKVEVKGGVPRILDSGRFNGDDTHFTKSFTGPGRLVVRSYNRELYCSVDGVHFTMGSSFGNFANFCDGSGYVIPFQSHLVIGPSVDIDHSYFDYILYEY